MSNTMTDIAHEHNWQFLRQETEREHGTRYGDLITVDIFFCTKCAEYLCKEVKRVQYGVSGS